MLTPKSAFSDNHPRQPLRYWRHGHDNLITGATDPATFRDETEITGIDNIGTALAMTVRQ
jgi:hypothetical protein